MYAESSASIERRKKATLGIFHVTTTPAAQQNALPGNRAGLHNPGQKKIPYNNAIRSPIQYIKGGAIVTFNRNPAAVLLAARTYIIRYP